MSDCNDEMIEQGRFTRRVFLYGAGAAMQAARMEGPAAGSDWLEQGFHTPPDGSKPWVFWWWLNGIVTREGITRDLEEMKRQGINGVLLFHAGGGGKLPAGPRFLSEDWTKLFRFALEETARLGMEMSVNLCDGWDSGGPWITPEEANKKLVYSEFQIDGPVEMDRALPAPQVIGDYYREVAVVGFREGKARPVQPAAVTVSSSVEGYCKELNWHPLDMVDNDPNTFWRANPKLWGTPGKPQWVEWQYHDPLPATAIYLAPAAGSGPRACELQTYDANGAWRTMASFEMAQGRATRVEFPETRSDRFRLLIHSAWVTDVRLAQAWLLRNGDEVSPRPGIQWWWFKSGNRSFWDYPKQGPGALDEEYPDDGASDVAAAEVIDLSGKLKPGGAMSWSVPAGRWTVLRFGYTLLGQETRASSTNHDGWEADMLDSRGMEKQFQAVAAPILDAAGDLAGRTLKTLHVDSYELGADVRGQQPTWSAAFRDEFRTRRGYDLLRFLPALARRIVDSREQTNRFLWDIRRTIGDLMAERFFGRFAELAHARGVGIDCETGYGTYPHPHIDGLQCAGKCDVTMGEFWHGTDIMSQFDSFCNVMRSVASAGHVYGRKVIQAESFTAWTHFQEYPASLKPVGDEAFCNGLTRVVVHQYTHQPKIGPKPGIQYFAGTHLDRNLTWWPQADAFLRYLGRCQHLLGAGRFHADLCYYYGEGATNFVPGRPHVRPELPAGYDCDFVNAEILLNHCSVRQGRIVLDSGMEYRVLVLSEKAALAAASLEKLRHLMESGATVIGRRPVARQAGLGGSAPAVARLVNSLWGSETAAEGERKIGTGRLIWGEPLIDVLENLQIRPDFETRTAGANVPIRFIHRTLPEAEIYFLANQADRRQDLLCAFRVAGKQPELWDPVTGGTVEISGWRAEGSQTVIPLRFEEYQSWFVVFRRPAGPEGDGKNFRDLQPVAELQGPWNVHFDPAWGGPESVVFETLEDWTRRPEEGIRYYSGKATYTRTFDVPPAAVGKTVWLDLGRLNHVAEVRVNGENLGVVWCAPWRVRPGQPLKSHGNRLEIDIVNLWPNRLIGDSLPTATKRYTETNLKVYKPESPLVASGLYGPVRLCIE